MTVMTEQPATRVHSQFYERTTGSIAQLLANSSLSKGPRITVVESHTQGEPTRIVVGGLPEFQEPNAVAMRDRFERECDQIRKLLLLEPRGHREMYSAFLFPPTRSDADLGVVFAHNLGFANMCGHGSIGVGTFAVQSGLVTGGYDSYAAIDNDDIDVRLDTPAGLVTVSVHVREHKVTGATLTNVPSFVAENAVILDVDYKDVKRQVKATIAFGGSFFALVDASALGLEISVDNSREVADLGMAILNAAKAQVEVRHPLEDIRGVDLVEFGSVLPGMRNYRNGVVFGDHQIDRSPCGTGTSAKLAAMVAHGTMDLHEPATFSSITGSTFIGEAVSRTSVGTYDAIIPQITGRAYTLGASTFVLDEDDIYPQGFLV